jgi:hypothetical protein
MRGFVVRVLQFLIPIGLLGFIVEGYLRIIPNNYAYLHERLMERRDSMEVLILGNSHTYNGLNPEGFFLPAINASNSAQDLRIDRLLLEKHIERSPRLKCVVLPVSYANIGRRMEQGPERWRAKNYIIYMDLPIPSWRPSYHLELLNRSMSKNIKLIMGHARRGTHNRVCAANGGTLGKPTQTANMEVYGRQVAQRHSLSVGGTIEENQRDLEAIVAICGERGIKLVLINPPGHESYRVNLEPVQLARSRLIPAAIADANDHVIYLDLLSDNRFLTDDFADSDHLNARGNAKLTAIVREEVLRLLNPEADALIRLPTSSTRSAHSSGSHRP